METERKLVVSIDDQGNKYLSGINMSVSVTKVETEEQRRIAALEERIAALEAALTGTQAQAVITEAKICGAVIESQSLCPR